MTRPSPPGPASLPAALDVLTALTSLSALTALAAIRAVSNDTYFNAWIQVPTLNAR